MIRDKEEEEEVKSLPSQHYSGLLLCLCQTCSIVMGMNLPRQPYMFRQRKIPEAVKDGEWRVLGKTDLSLFHILFPRDFIVWWNYRKIIVQENAGKGK